jgi:hypothetical protein
MILMLSLLQNVRPAVGHEADQSPQSSAEVKNEWSHSFTPPACLLGMYRDNFTSTTPSLSVMCNFSEKSQQSDQSFYAKYGLYYSEVS